MTYPIRQTHSTQRRQLRRRGVTLLLVLALMTMFAMLVVTFMIVTTQFRAASETAAKALISPKDPGKGFSTSTLVDSAFQKLLTGGLDCAIGPFSILENLYGTPEYDGNDPLAGQTNGIVSAPGSSSGARHVLYFDLNPTGTLFTDSVANDYSYADLIGHVLTVTEVPLNPNDDDVKEYLNKSALILDIDDDGVVVAPFTDVADELKDEDSTMDKTSKTARQATLLNGDTCSFVINTPAFSGTGPGFDSSKKSDEEALANGDDDNAVYALRPNILAPDDGSNQSYKDALQDNIMLMNPDYTAPDTANLFLAWYDVNSSNGDIDGIIPSFHRPQLIAHHNPGTGDEDLLRKIVLRPLQFDHPNFSGSNPALDTANVSTLVAALRNGPLDVDNDGDGIADGIWIDAGLKAVYDKEKSTWYKPLVSFLVLDLDGRVNLNVHGNLDLAGTSPSGSSPDPATGGLLTILGSGAGSGEVRLDKVLTSEFETIIEGEVDGTNPMPGRYGGKQSPGSFEDDAAIQSDATDFKTATGIDPFLYIWNGQGYGGIEADLFGVSPIKFDKLGNRLFDGLPGDLFAQNPYLMNPYVDRDGDKPFTAEDFQLLLRSPGDLDFANLPVRLRKLLGDNMDGDKVLPDKWSDFRHSATFRGSDIPVFSRFGGSGAGGSFPSLYRYIRNEIFKTDNSAADFYKLLPEEIRRGEKVNLNRLTYDQDWTDLTSNDAMLVKKAKFAQGIFYLLAFIGFDQLYPGGVGTAPDPEVVTRLAQWSVNLVDFMDADAIMTPFVFKIDPFSAVYDNEDDVQILITNDKDFSSTLTDWKTAGKHVVWGFEKPMVALTETFAVHNRRTANATANPTDTCSKCEVPLDLCIPETTCQEAEHTVKTFKQVLKPEASLFVELYHVGNNNRTLRLDDGFGTTPEIDLAATGSGGDGAPVWRLAVSESTRSADASDLFKTPGGSDSGAKLKWSDDAALDNDYLAKSRDGNTSDIEANVQWTATADLTPERFIWFVGSVGLTDLPDDSSFYPVGSASATLQPNELLVLAPNHGGSVSFASQTVTSSLMSFGEPVGADRSRIDVSGLSNCITMADGNGYGLNISAPMVGYSGTPGNAAAPFSEDNHLFGWGTIPCYKTILLQRLADPKRNYNADTNPYITVDWQMIDLHVINSESNTSVYDNGKAIVAWRDEPNPADTDEKLAAYTQDLYLTSRQWGYTGLKTSEVDSEYPNIWSRMIGTDGDTDYAGLKNPTTVSNNPSELRHDTEVTLGDHNKLVVKGGGTISFTAGATGGPNKSFLHFPWHDAPLTNTMELMLVPACNAGRFGIDFYDTGNDPDWIATTSLLSPSRFRNKDPNVPGIYLNFFHGEDNTGANKSLNLARLFEYVRVPSRFAGTIRGWTNDTPPRPIFEMREPGKINLNTADENAWEALTGGDQNRYPSYSDLKNLREDTTAPELFYKPFRSPQSANLVGHADLLPAKPAATTLLRDDGSNLFIEPNQVADKGTNPYTELENVMRLSDMTTTRSNVFAVWITVGFFEAKQYVSDMTDDTSVDNGITDLINDHSSVGSNFPSAVADRRAFFRAVYPDGCVFGAEKGLDDGTVKRQRGFYLIDRSIPVGFRRGQTLNSTDVRILRSVLD